MRCRAEHPTVRIPHQTLRDLAAEWHRSLNNSPAPLQAEATATAATSATRATFTNAGGE